jgi:hypothetical protein
MSDTITYNVTFIGDHANLATTVSVATKDDETDEEVVIDAAVTHLTDYYGIDPTKVGLATVDIEVEYIGPT